MKQLSTLLFLVFSIVNAYTTPIEIDASLQIDAAILNKANCVAVQPDGKIIVGGEYNTSNGSRVIYRSSLRLNIDGSLDESFTIAEHVMGPINSIKIQDDGKILLFGAQITQIEGINTIVTTSKGVVRLNTDGTVDETFSIPGTGFNSTVRDGTIQPDGKILVYGLFTNVNSQALRSVARINTDGSIDSSFNIGNSSQSDGNVSAVLLQNDGKIVVGGSFKKFNTQNSPYLIRLNSDGSYDNSFNHNELFKNDVRSLAMLPDGKMLVGGNLWDPNFKPFRTKTRIVRLNNDGSEDNTFTIGTGFNSYPYAYFLQNDGKIIVGGDFGMFNNEVVGGLVRLNSDGTRDSSFDVGVGFYRGPSGGGLTYIDNMIVQSDGKILVTGNFQKYNDTPVNRIVRLVGDGNAAASTQVLNFGKDIQLAYNPTNHSIFLKNAPESSNLRIFNLNGALVLSQNRLNQNESMDVSALERGVYLVQIKSDVLTATRKVLIIK